MFRLLGLLGGLSVVTDLGTGSRLEESLKRCLVATRLARAAGCADAEVSDVIYSALLEHLGCTAFAHEGAAVWGDDIASVRLALRADFTRPGDVWRTWVAGVAESTGRSRARVLATTLTVGRKVDAVAPVATCEVARDAARRLSLPETVQDSLFHVVAMWNGKGYPPAAGDAIPLSTRIVHVASTAVLFAMPGGPEAGVAEVRRRSGTHLDPALADVLLGNADELLGGLPDIDAYAAVLAEEPDPVRYVDERGVESVARTFGDLVDLKTPWFQGHSAGVADLAAAAVCEMGLSSDEDVTRVAGHLHDLGRVGVSNRIWEKPERLSGSEEDQVRLHAYHSERILTRVPALAEAGRIAGRHHERCDGSGYHRGVSGSALTMPARVLAAADSFRGLAEDRPHRPGLPVEQVAAHLRDEVRAGRLDGDAVAAVLRASGQRSRPSRPADLTERQVEVLRLLAQGLSNREIARRLVISSRTAEHHVQDVYLKIGASTRAAAALFAMEHGLLGRPR